MPTLSNPTVSTINTKKTTCIGEIPNSPNRASTSAQTYSKSHGAPSSIMVFFHRLKHRGHKKSVKENYDTWFRKWNLMSDISDVTEGNPVQGPMNWTGSKKGVTNKRDCLVHRQDKRSPKEIIEAGGFHPRVLELESVKIHTRAPGWKTEGAVSTSKIHLQASSGRFGEYEYLIKLKAKQAIDVNKTFGPSNSTYMYEYELLVPGHISLDQIVAWRRTATTIWD